VTFGDDSYSLTTTWKPEIGLEGHPTTKPPSGGEIVDHGYNQCKCLAANYANNSTDRPYNGIQSNSNWWANNLLKCCGINLDMPSDASGWNTGGFGPPFKCCKNSPGPEPLPQPSDPGWSPGPMPGPEPLPAKPPAPIDPWGPALSVPH